MSESADDQPGSVTPSPAHTVTPPPAPRPLTPRLARQAWTEPTVRRWWLMALAVVVAVGAFAGDRLWVRHGENRLIGQGVATTATVLSNPLHSKPGQTADAGMETTVRFPFGGRDVTLNGFLTRTTSIGATVPIHVDPADPSVWTDQTEPTPVLHAVFVGLLLLPLAGALAAVAWLRQRAVVHTARFGRPAVAVVAARGQVPTAPLCFAVRCSLRDGPDRTIRTVYIPPAGRSLAKGDDLWLLVPARGRPVAAMWFS